MVKLKYRLGKMDKLCQTSLRKFKIMLPELEAKDLSERKEVLIRILTRYKSLIETEYPDAMDTISWDEFTEWHQQWRAQASQHRGRANHAALHRVS